MSVDLVNLCAAVVVFSLLMYILLDGADLGVGMLFLLFPDQEERRRLVASILPVWDANETWLVLFAGGLLALFPAAYSLMFTGLYLPLFIMLLALFARAVALQYRSHASSRFRFMQDAIFILSSLLAAFSQGVMAGVVIDGLLPNGALAWIAPFPLICGGAVVASYLLLGCGWIRWRLRGDVGQRASRFALLFLGLTIAAFVALGCLHPAYPVMAWQYAGGKILLLASLALCIAVALLLFSQRLMLPLIAALLMVTCLLGVLVAAIYPWLIPNVITLQQASASPATQSFILIGIAIVMPLTLIYNSWSFWVFRGKVE